MSLTQVSSILSDVKYDLRDQGSQKYDDTYLLKMLNRGIRILDRELISIGSDLTIHRTSGTLTTGYNTLEVTNVVDTLRHVYIGQNELEPLSLKRLYQRQLDEIGSTTGEPKYYSTWVKPASSEGRAIAFDYTANIDYTIDYIYYKLTGTLTESSYLPYDNMFDDYLREGMVLICRKTKDGSFLSSDRVWREMYRMHMHQFSIGTAYRQKMYNIDF